MDKGLTAFERDEAYLINIQQLGYTKVNTGSWIESIVDDGQGFPKTIYHCPFCNTEGNGTNYCPNCGARLNNEID